MKKLKKILIISYFFPPSTFTGSFRISSWAKYLSEFGYYPVIVTRNWNVRITEYKDMSESISGEIIHCKFNNYEVYYLPYKGNLRDRLYQNFGDSKMILPRRLLSLFEVIFQNFSTRIIPFRNLLLFSNKLLKNEQDIMCMIASGKPYVLFYFCHKLAIKYKIPWIADYRDDWNTSQWLTNLTLGEKLIMNLEKISEKNWLSNASCFTSISSNYVKLISDFIKKPGFVIMNGYDPDDYSGIKKIDPSNTFTILFNGTLYDTQPVEIFINAYINFINNSNKKPIVKLIFLGLNFEKKQANRIRKLLAGYEFYYEITDRVDKKSALARMAEAHVFLMFSHTNIKGVTSSKLFDYLAIGKPIILCPTDNEILEELVLSTNSGFVCNTSRQVHQILINLYSEFIEKGVIQHCPDKEKIKEYTRSNQTLSLSKVLDNIYTGEIKNESLPEEKTFIRKFAFNILNNKLLRVMLRNLNGGKSIVRILCFHNISDKSDLAYPSIKPELFYELIKYLNKEYDIIPISELQNCKQGVKRPMLLTFDDGYRNFIEFALPVLKEFKAPAINNIIVDCVENERPFWTQRLNYDLSYIFRNFRSIDFTWNGISIKNNLTVTSPQQISLAIYKKLLTFEQTIRENFLSEIENHFNIEKPDNWGLMNWSEIKTCSENNIIIGSHTMTHNTLITINEKFVLNFEIAESKRVIEKHLGKNIETIAFPNGIYDDRCIELAKEAGYKYLLTTKESYYHVTNREETEFPIILPRISINSNDNNENFLRVENFHNLVKFNFS
jgi:peptidoglycan/xylan/chitin deacetylase (PgdA/CDA1 family)/glycosyltransferase involved in cell wall biosynthesis